jgi:hypothetical protein
MGGLRTEFDFTLPKGYVGSDGTLHRQGTMRLATARDEIEPLRDRTIDGPDDPYLTILVLARVITSLGSLPDVGIEEVEGLFAADLAFLQDLYGIINFGDQADVEALQASVLPDDVQPDDVQFDDVVEGDVETDIAEVEDVSDSGEAEAPRRRRSHIEEVTSVSS